MPELSRQQLYERVWSTPMSKLSKEFGLSDRGLAKLCARYDIPCPPRGYWARLAAGQTPKITPLPPREENQNVFFPERTQHDDGLAAKIEARRSEVDTSIQKPKASDQDHSEADPAVLHGKLKKAARRLRSQKVDMTANGERASESAYGLRVSTAHSERALFILSQIIEAVELRGVGVEIVQEGMSAHLDGDKIRFSLTEKTRQFPHEPTAKEKAEDARRERLKAQRRRNSDWNSWEGIDLFSSRPKFDAIFQGNLQFQIDSYSNGLRRSWGDGKQQRLEDLVPQIVDGIDAQLVAARHRRDEHERWRREYEELERRRGLYRARKAREQKRLEFLKSLLDAQSELARLDELRRSFGPCPSDAEDFRRFDAWLQARAHALENRLGATALQDEAKRLELFPDPDPLHDPIGDPPHSHWD